MLFRKKWGEKVKFGNEGKTFGELTLRNAINKGAIRSKSMKNEIEIIPPK